MAVNEITISKQEFALVLDEAGLRVLDYIPERVTPPIVIVAPGSPYLEPASINGEFKLNLEVTCVASMATNKQASEKLDALVADLLNALPGYAQMDNVSKPFELVANGASYLASTVNIELQITI